MKYNKTHLLYGLFAILAVLYVSKIYLTKNLTSLLVVSPVKLSFAVIQAPEKACNKCFDAGTIIKSIESSQKTTYKTKNISFDNPISKQYVEKYQIKNLPAIVVSGDIANEKIARAWKSLSGKEVNKSIVLENLLPYYDIKNASIKGQINATLLKDSSCENCFDENIYLNILKNFGLIVNSTNTYDVSSKEGKALVENYAIYKLPTLILSSGTKDYANFVNAWSEVGTIEEDGNMVLRNVEKINTQYTEL